MQVPVSEILARTAPLPPTFSSKPKSSNFLQVPDVEQPRYLLRIAEISKFQEYKYFWSPFRPKSVPNSPSVQRAFSNLRHQLTSAWSSHSSKKRNDHSQLTPYGRKKWLSTQDFSGQGIVFDKKAYSHAKIIEDYATYSATIIR